jgi:hypothetical protein
MTTETAATSEPIDPVEVTLTEAGRLLAELRGSQAKLWDFGRLFQKLPEEVADLERLTAGWTACSSFPNELCKRPVTDQRAVPRPIYRSAVVGNRYTRLNARCDSPARCRGGR